jgi:hypothetical protein
MRVAVSVAILVSASFLLAGCSKSGEGDELHYQCPGGVEIHQDDHPSANTTTDLAKFCPRSSTSGSKSNSTTSAPNKLPTLVLKITDMDGAESPVTLLDGNLTFDATGSTDSDGSIAGIAVTVTDSNTTRTGTLYDAAKKQFNKVTFRFDRAGVVNVTVAMVDDRAGFTVNQTHVYVNTEQHVGVSTVNFPMGNQLPTGADECDGGDPLVDAQYFTPVSFDVSAGATRIDATSVSPDAVLTICKPEGESAHTPVSPQATHEVTTDPGVELPAPIGIAHYQVGVYNGGTSPQMPNAMVVVVHYEPQTAA